MSGYTEDAVLRHGVFQNSVAFLGKPFSPPALIHKLREVLEGDWPARRNGQRHVSALPPALFAAIVPSVPRRRSRPPRHLGPVRACT